jgi:hypothetical protein
VLDASEPELDVGVLVVLVVVLVGVLLVVVVLVEVLPELAAGVLLEPVELEPREAVPPPMDTPVPEITGDPVGRLTVPEPLTTVVTVPVGLLVPEPAPEPPPEPPPVLVVTGVVVVPPPVVTGVGVSTTGVVGAVPVVVPPPVPLPEPLVPLEPLPEPREPDPVVGREATGREIVAGLE